MAPEQYATLADVYDFLVVDALLTPAGCVAAFAPVIESLAPGARVLDCACGPGTLAVGLALRGFDVVATDASGAMIERTRGLAEEHGVELPARVCRWEKLSDDRPFDAVFCVGNSLAHAEGSGARREALARMAAALAPGGLLAVTSRNWELERAAGSRIDVDEELIERGGRRGLKIQAWTIPEDWEEPHTLELTVALIDGARVTPRGERLTVWPFTHETLAEDLRAAGLTPALSTYTADAGRYLVTATA